MQCTESNNDQAWRQKLSGVFSIVRDGAQFLGPIGPWNQQRMSQRYAAILSSCPLV